MPIEENYWSGSFPNLRGDENPSGHDFASDVDEGLIRATEILSLRKHESKLVKVVKVPQNEPNMSRFSPYVPR